MTNIDELPFEPDVSWILCTNTFDRLCEEAIDSCLSQSFSNFELILIANGDQKEELAALLRVFAERDSRVRVFSTAVRHLPFCLSLGVHHAKSKLIARMDADDVSAPERLEMQVSYMRANPEVTALGSSYQELSIDGEIGRIVLLPQTDVEIRRALPWRNPICHPSIIVRREALLRAGGYLGGLKAEDYDLWCRLSLDPSVIFHNTSTPLLFYRVNPEGAARRSREAYITVASTQLRMLLSTMNIVWLGGIVLTIVKALLRSNKV